MWDHIPSVPEEVDFEYIDLSDIANDLAYRHDCRKDGQDWFQCIIYILMIDKCQNALYYSLLVGEPAQVLGYQYGNCNDQLPHAKKREGRS